MMLRLVRPLVAMLVAGLLLGAVAAISAQDDKKQPEMPKPGPEHALLKKFEGTWNAAIKMWMEPGKDPTESKGTMMNKIDFGGFWLVENFGGEFGGQEFHGHGLLGYDPLKKKYIGTWLDSMSPHIMVSEGTFDDAGKILTQTGDAPDMTGKIVKHKMVTEIKDENTHVFTMSTGGADGGEKTIMVITYTRK